MLVMESCLLPGQPPAMECWLMGQSVGTAQLEMCLMYRAVCGVTVWCGFSSGGWCCWPLQEAVLELALDPEKGCDSEEDLSWCGSSLGEPLLTEDSPMLAGGVYGGLSPLGGMPRCHKV